MTHGELGGPAAERNHRLVVIADSRSMADGTLRLIDRKSLPRDGIREIRLPAEAAPRGR